MEKLLKRLAEIDGTLDALAGSVDLTDAQVAEHDTLQAERAKVIAAIGRAKAIAVRATERESVNTEAAAAQAATQRASRTVGTPRITTTDDVPSGATGVRTDAQGRVTSYFEGTDESIELRFGDSPDAQRRQSYKQARRSNNRFLKDSGYVPWGEFPSAREFITAGLSGHQHSSFRERVGKHYSAVVGMSEGVGTSGGYLVMPEFASGIIDRLYNMTNLWSRTDNYTVTGNSMTFNANAETSRAHGARHGGLRGYWLGEGATKTPSAPTFRQITLKLVKLAVVVYLTDELLEDTGSVLQSYVERKAAEEFDFLIGDALINGNGVGQPLGLLNWPSLISVAAEVGQDPDTLETENIIKMFSRFYGPHRGNMIWMHNQDIEPELFTMTLGVGTGGVVTYMPPGGLSSAPYATLMGRPMIPTEWNPTLGDQGDIIAADLGQMLSISKGGIAQAVSIHVEFLTDQTALRFVMRLNAGPWEAAPLTPFKGTNTQSSAVTLDAR